MRGIKTELIVGMFVLAVFGVLAYMTIKVADIEWGEVKGYRVYADFRNVAGLDEKTKIKVAGVNAGVVEDIELMDGIARVTLRIYPDVKLYSDSEASIRASGLLGDKYLYLKVGSKAPLLKDGDAIPAVKDITDVDDLIETFADAAKNINNLVSGINNAVQSEEVKTAMMDTLRNMRDLTQGIKETVQDNKDKFSRVLDRVESLVSSLDNLVKSNQSPITNTVANLNEFAQALKESGPDLVRNLSKAAEELKTLLAENRPSITAIANRTQSAMGSLSNITGRIDRGEGTIGKLVKDERLYASLSNAVDGVDKAITSITRFRTFITFQGEYLFGDRDGKGSFLVTLQPRDNKYYIVGLTSDPVGSVEVSETTTNGVLVREEKRTSRLEFTAQLARRYKDAALRIGLTENTFGVGSDYFFLKDKLKFSADAWDFNQDEYKSKSPHVKMGFDYFVFKNVFISGGVDNLLNSERRGAYAGAGLKFEDEDFKYIFGTVPRIPGQ